MLRAVYTFRAVTRVLVSSLAVAGAVEAQEVVYRLPDTVSVLPVFFVPEGEKPPTHAQADRLMRHLRWSQRSYRGWLGGATFGIASETPDVHRASHPLSYYQELPESGVAETTAELLDHYGFNRFTLPYILLTVFVNPRERFPVGQGRPLNGGYDTGGGIVVMSTHLLDSLANFQSTLEHELGHGFGLPHVDVFSYDMATSASIMSYNQDHLTDRFVSAVTPGSLIGEDIRGLALNGRVFPQPVVAAMADSIDDGDVGDPVWLGPLVIPGQPDYALEVSTPSGETFLSSAENSVIGVIRPSAGPGITYDQTSMWTSDVTGDGWATLDVTFPITVGLSRLGVHSQHSGLYHAARSVKVATVIDGVETEVARRDLASPDSYVEFPRNLSRSWRFRFLTGQTRMVVIRGLEFFDGEDEVFPPLIVYPGVRRE
ncbi:MAG: hypothetical protein BMS9Abin29_1059 [Gemmatimonadota bacterium]|nr:MAG: hypothetical protein BMS9Abin29_1059 [Gemmatimonadota bacterium]